jgi:hypothetical protein
MTYNEVTEAIDNGKSVYWSHEGYSVVDDYKGSYYIMHLSGSCVGFSEEIYKTSYSPLDFFLGE